MNAILITAVMFALVPWALFVYQYTERFRSLQYPLEVDTTREKFHYANRNLAFGKTFAFTTGLSVVLFVIGYIFAAGVVAVFW